MPPKSTEQELRAEQEPRDEIERFDIKFVGPLLPSEWPDQYANVFKKVRKIGNTSWEPDESEAPVADNDTPDRRRTKIRALELMNEAKADRKDRVNEPTLRGNAEPLVFERFKKAVKCDDVGETKLFRNYSDEFVHIDVSDSFKRRKQSRHKPDLVWGLRKTKSVGQYRSEFDNRHDRDHLRHSPFANSDLLYPFLIVESKREGKGPGFEYAEAQSAFPIRTCLKLQEALQRVSAQPLTPLLWFLAYQGDEWRVAACVVEGGKYRIYDLWMGRIVSKEGALQLLLIIDHIAEWAREIYRFDILCCLAGGRDQVLEADNMSDTYRSRLSTKSQSVFNSSSFGEPQPSDLASCHDGEDAVMEDLGTMPQADNRTVRDTVKLHHFLRWLQMPVPAQSLAQPHTIRHANMVVFSFSHLSIPSDRESLEKLLVSISRPNTATTQEIAFLLLSKFRDQREGLVATTRLRIDLLKSEWLRLGPAMIDSTATGVRALFSVRTFIRNHDWQIERELLSISCSREAAQELASIAGIRAEELRVSTEWAVETTEFPSSSFAELRCMTGRVSASAAIHSQVFHLMHSSNHDGYQWVPRSGVNELTKSCFLWAYGIRNDDSLSASVDRKVNQAMEVLGKPKLANNIKNLFQSLPLLEGSAALLHRVRSEGDSSSTPIYCLMVLKQVDFYDTRAMGDIIAEVKARGICHKVTLGCPVTTDPMEACKERFGADLYGNVFERWLGELHP